MTIPARPRSIGQHIREKLLPKGMTVKAAAELTGVGRPALSNLLNGNASLSPEMAAKLGRAFGADAQELLDIQARIDGALAVERGVAATARAYVPPFLQIKANSISTWAGTIQSRSRFAVFLRTLVNSTNPKLVSCDFPGNDDAERPGWDGFVEAAEGNPWVPVGKSGWEFGTNQNPKAKADKDFTKSIGQWSAAERAEISFVFVTPHRWDAKKAWLAARRAEKKWKNVLAFDGSDLEQWLEQSIPAQAWLANETDLPSDGVKSLDACWRQWATASEPHLSELLFQDAVQAAREIAARKLLGPSPASLKIAADSTDEALAFLSCLLSPSADDLHFLRERVAVFEKAGALTRLCSKSSDFIVVTTNRDVEKELATLGSSLRSVIVHPKNSGNAEPDISLEPLGFEQFRVALEAMGFNRDEIDRLGRESGRSRTVLRRRLSTFEAIRSPAWAREPQVIATLKPFVFSGAWKANSEADRIILSMLAGERPYNELETDLARLAQMEDSPVVSLGQHRGLVSKIDVLFAIHRSLTRPEIEHFLSVAKLVLSEDDPALDLPEEERWAAAIHGKQRDISGTLREGVCETLVLLAVHGNGLLQDRLGLDIEAHISRLVQDLLRPITARGLEAQSGDLPMYAEAAPETFLSIIEHDLDGQAPQSLELMRPASTGIFSGCPRTGLLWALENLAWNPRRLTRVVSVLSRFAQITINDNWANKPTASLSAIFRSWMPQTAATLEQRIAALEYLCREYPTVGWPICVEQFDGHSTVGHYSHKPRWRSDGAGFGEPVGRREANDFALRAFEIAIAWPEHTAETLSDLARAADNLAPELQSRIWPLIEEWSGRADDREKAKLKEVVRITAFSRRALRKKDGTDRLRQAKRILTLLEPTDELAKHEWLFKKQWVEESYEEFSAPDFDFQRREERIRNLRIDALKSVLKLGGLDAVLDLARRGEAWSVIGNLLPKALPGDAEVAALAKALAAKGPLSESRMRRDVMAGLLHRVAGEKNFDLFAQIIEEQRGEARVDALLQAPFERNTWNHLSGLRAEERARYWEQVSPSGWWDDDQAANLEFAITQLIDAGRPRAAFLSSELKLPLVKPTLLFRLMKAMATESKEASGTYQISSYHLLEAFKTLNGSGEIALDEMAGLEFLFMGAFMGEEAGIPNLEKQIESQPDWFIHAVVFCFKRSDGGEDPAELKPATPELAEARATAAYRMLDKLRRIPGRDKFGNLDEGAMLQWVQTVRSSCEQLGRRDICDQMIAKIYAHAPIGEDGVWPALPARNVMEKITNKMFEDGLHVALYNKRGAHWRGEGGDDERALSARYEAWAQAVESTHPRVSKMLRGMARDYDSEARWHDQEAGVRRRIE